ncbi:hypothetical protein B0H16DRAFT_1836104 [Mycena metata]|uniref:Uncharacterized protein n=1 Tax=Mycena metata TaxID=1033252 RepID=A0AAD7J2A8_9AGAR|nr:hypothetical protein B0H16DRAFT_1836104 [Mycena metata]
MANPVVHTLCSMLKHTEKQLHGVRRGKLEFEIVTGKQTSRLRIKLADTKIRLQAAQKRFDDLEEQTGRALCDVVIGHRKLQCLAETQNEFPAVNVWKFSILPRAINLVQCGHTLCHTCIIDLMKSSLKDQYFQTRAGSSKTADDYKEFFPEFNFDRDSGPSRIPGCYTQQTHRVRIGPRVRQPRLNSPAYRPRWNPHTQTTSKSRISIREVLQLFPKSLSVRKNFAAFTTLMESQELPVLARISAHFGNGTVAETAQLVGPDRKYNGSPRKHTVMCCKGNIARLAQTGNPWPWIKTRKARKKIAA